MGHPFDHTSDLDRLNFQIAVLIPEVNESKRCHLYLSDWHILELWKNFWKHLKEQNCFIWINIAEPHWKN